MFSMSSPALLEPNPWMRVHTYRHCEPASRASRVIFGNTQREDVTRNVLSGVGQQGVYKQGKTDIRLALGGF